MEKMIAKEIVFRFGCKSLDGLVMSISVDEFIRMMNKDDPTIRKLRSQFEVKTKLRTDKLQRQYEEDDSEDS